MNFTLFFVCSCVSLDDVFHFKIFTKPKLSDVSSHFFGNLLLKNIKKGSRYQFFSEKNMTMYGSPFSLFQALCQWDDRNGGQATSGVWERIGDPARRPLPFSIVPTDGESGRGWSRLGGMNLNLEQKRQQQLQHQQHFVFVPTPKKHREKNYIISSSVLLSFYRNFRLFHFSDTLVRCMKTWCRSVKTRTSSGWFKWVYWR